MCIPFDFAFICKNKKHANWDDTIKNYSKTNKKKNDEKFLRMNIEIWKGHGMPVDGRSGIHWSDSNKRYKNDEIKL